MVDAMKRLFVTTLICMLALDEGALTRPRHKSLFFRQQAADNILDALIRTFITLVTSRTAANLIDELRNPESFTIFAPTETAFVQLPADIYGNLFTPETENLLQQLLLHHVVGDSIIELPGDDMNVTTVGLQNLTISNEDGLSFVNDVQINEANITATNGMIHSIDDVLIPEGPILNPTISPAFPSVDVRDDPMMLAANQMDSPVVVIDDSFTSVTVNIVFDDAPEEIGWLIQDVTDNSVVASQAVGTYPYSIDGVDETIRLREGMYLFGIEDAAGDGLCCDSPGIVTVSIDDEVLGTIEGNFGSFEFLSFSVP